MDWEISRISSSSIRPKRRAAPSSPTASIMIAAFSAPLIARISSLSRPGHRYASWYIQLRMIEIVSSGCLSTIWLICEREDFLTLPSMLAMSISAFSSSEILGDRFHVGVAGRSLHSRLTAARSGSARRRPPTGPGRRLRRVLSRRLPARATRSAGRPAGSPAPRRLASTSSSAILKISAFPKPRMPASATGPSPRSGCANCWLTISTTSPALFVKADRGFDECRVLLQLLGRARRIGAFRVVGPVDKNGDRDAVDLTGLADQRRDLARDFEVDGLFRTAGVVGVPVVAGAVEAGGVSAGCS